MRSFFNGLVVLRQVC